MFDFKSRKIIKMPNIKSNGKKCFILATGASLIDFDLDLIKDEFKLGFGFCFLHPKINSGFLDAYVLLDNYHNNNFNANFPKDILIKGKDNAFSLYKKIIELEIPNLFINYNNYSVIKKEFGDVFNKSFFFKINSNLNKIEFNSGKKRFLTFPSTIITSIQIAVSLGFKDIYILGAGYTYKPVNLYHFYDTYSSTDFKDTKLFIKKSKNFINERKKISGKDIGFMSLVKKFDKYYALFYENRKDDDHHYIFHKKLDLIAKKNDVSITNVVPKNFDSKIYNKISSQKLKKILINEM